MHFARYMLGTLIATLALAAPSFASPPRETMRATVRSDRTITMTTHHRYTQNAIYYIHVDGRQWVFSEMSGRDHVWAYSRGVTIFITAPQRKRWSFRATNLSRRSHEVSVSLVLGT